MKYALCLLALFTTCAEAGRYDSHEMRNFKQEFCHQGGQLAVGAREHPDLAQQRINENNQKNHITAKAWSESMLTGLLAGPNVSDRDLHMRGWAACMDVMQRR